MARLKARRSRYRFTTRLAGSAPAAILVVLLLLTVGGATYFASRVLTFVNHVTGGGVTIATITQAAGITEPPLGSIAYRLKHKDAVPINILMLGYGGQENDAPYLSDTIMAVRLDPASGRVSMISIPRDLWVPISTGGSDRIDVAYSYGGASAAIATVQMDFHVHVDDYVWIGLKGLIKVIDIVGGVDVVTSNPVLDDYYPSDIDVQNPYGYYRVAVLPGAQHLNGAHALEYVRSRHSDLRGDFGRSQRQQQVLLALRARAKALKPADLPDVASAFAGELTTSMSLTRIRDLLPLAGGLQADSVHQVVLFGDYTIPDVIDGQDILLPNWNKILPVVSQYFP